ncbi:MAG: SDR family oxidoreductase, partial [Planctomycetota bacterium]
MSTLKDRIALVTGASAGIGWATAEHLAEAGAHVVVTARRTEKLATLVDALRTKGHTAHALPADVSDPAAIDALWAKTQDVAGGVPSIVVANAGRGLQGGVLSSDESHWQQMIQLNITGNLHLMRIVAEAMKEGNGPRDIVVLGSVVGVNISPFSGAYGATKFAIGSAAEALRREVGPHGVRVTLIKPGIVATEFQDVAGYDHENFGKVVE